MLPERKKRCGSFLLLMPSPSLDRTLAPDAFGRRTFSLLPSHGDNKTLHSFFFRDLSARGGGSKAWRGKEKRKPGFAHFPPFFLFCLDANCAQAGFIQCIWEYVLSIAICGCWKHKMETFGWKHPNGNTQMETPKWKHLNGNTLVETPFVFYRIRSAN